MTSSPSVRRRIVASELRRLRLAREESQQDVEKATGLGRASLSRYESCQSSIQPAAARTVFSYLGVTGERLDALVELARGARKRNWLRDPADSVPSWFGEFLVLERDASEISELAITLVPGRLQTEAYARAVLTGGVLGSNVEDHVATRMERATAQRETSAPRLWVVMRESVLQSHVGGSAVMREQLEYLIEMAARPEVTIQVIPATLGAHPSMGASFTLLKFDIAPAFGVIYEESIGGALYRDDPNSVTPYETAYRHLSACALGETASVSLIKQTIEDIYA